MLNHEDRYCPIVRKQIDSEVCYEVIMCLYNGFSPTSVPEVKFKNDEKTKTICENCKHSNWC